MSGAVRTLVCRGNRSEVHDSTNGKEKRIRQLLATSGGGWGLHPAASGNDMRSRVPTYGMPDLVERLMAYAAGCGVPMAEGRTAVKCPLRWDWVRTVVLFPCEEGRRAGRVSGVWCVQGCAVC